MHWVFGHPLLVLTTAQDLLFWRCSDPAVTPLQFGSDLYACPLFQLQELTVHLHPNMFLCPSRHQISPIFLVVCLWTFSAHMHAFNLSVISEAPSPPPCSADSAVTSGIPTLSRKHRSGSARMALYRSYPVQGQTVMDRHAITNQQKHRYTGECPPPSNVGGTHSG